MHSLKTVNTTMTPRKRHTIGRTLTLGFGTASAMWALGYLAMMGPGLIIGEILFALTLLCLIAGGLIVGRISRSMGEALRTGGWVGALSALLNLLIIGSLIGGETTGERLASFGAWTLGAFLISITLCVLGAAAGYRWLNHPDRVGTDRDWFHRFACVAAFTVFLLLVTGGIVTGFEAGLAVPDWPNSFGHNMLLYPLSEMVGGVFYEHAHRLYGMLVGVTTMALAAALFFLDPKRRGWLRALGIIVLLMVCVQGLLGGLRVTGHLTFDSDPGVMNPNTHLAVVHGVFGQVVFAAIIAVAAFTSPLWVSDRSPKRALGAGSDHSMSVALIVLLVLQLALGALYRHFRRDAGDPTSGLEIMFVHIFLAFIVAGVAVFVGGRAASTNRDQPILPGLGKALMILIGLQILLGFTALVAALHRGTAETIPLTEVIFTSLHQSTGAAILGLATLIAVWNRRLLAEPVSDGAASGSGPGPGPGPEMGPGAAA